MALNFASVSNDQGLTQLNNYLAGNTYVFGFSISSADAQLFAVSLFPKISNKCMF